MYLQGLKRFIHGELLRSGAALSPGLLDDVQPSTDLSSNSDVPKTEAEPDLTLWTEGVFEPPASIRSDFTSTNSLDLAPSFASDLPMSTSTHACLKSAMFGDENALDPEESALSRRQDKFSFQALVQLSLYPALFQEYMDILDSLGTNSALEVIQQYMIAIGKSMYSKTIYSCLHCTYHS